MYPYVNLIINFKKAEYYSGAKVYKLKKRAGAKNRIKNKTL